MTQGYVYDIPSMLETQLVKQFGISISYYSLLYTLYSLPNAVLPLFGGYFIDNFGSEAMLLVTCSVTVLGQWIVFLGICLEHFPLMLLGRFVFGSGAEIMTMLQFLQVS